MKNNNFDFQQQQQQLRMLQQQQQGDWRGAISEKERLPIIERLTLIMIGSPYAQGKTKTELFQKMKELEGIEFQKAPTRESYLAQMTLMIKNAEFKKSTITATGQPRPMATNQNQPAASMMNPYMQSLQGNLMNHNFSYGSSSTAQNMQPILPATFNQNSQIAVVLNQTIMLYQNVGASLKQKNPAIEMKLKEFEASRPKSQYEKKMLNPNEKLIVNSILSMLNRLYPSLDALAYYMFLNRNNHEESLIKLIGIKSIMADQFKMAQQDIFYFTPQICTQLIGALREMINSWMEFQRKVAMDNRQATPGVQLAGSNISATSGDITVRSDVAADPPNAMTITEVLKRDFECNPEFTSKTIESLLFPNFHIAMTPKPKPTTVVDVEQVARDLFGPCYLVDPDFEDFPQFFSNFKQTIEEELEAIKLSFRVNLDTQIFEHHHLTVTVTNKNQVLILSIPNIEDYQKGNRFICNDLILGFSDEQAQFLDNLLTQQPSLRSCVELLFPTVE